MLTTLTAVKTRLSIPEIQIGHDALIAMLIAGVSARFPRELRRILKRTEDLGQVFPAADTSVNLCCYPVESIDRVEVMRAEHEGWQPRDGLRWIIRGGCVVVFPAPPGSRGEVARVIYTGGYVLPEAGAPPGASLLPADLENAATAQVAYWYLNRDRLGVIRQWPKGGTYEQYSELDLLPGVTTVLRHHQRFG